MADGVKKADVFPRPFEGLVYGELFAARQKHESLNSLHEGYAVIVEEIDEFWAEVKKRAADRDPDKLLSELVQIAAMCQRTAEDVGLVGR